MSRITPNALSRNLGSYRVLEGGLKRLLFVLALLMFFASMAHGSDKSGGTPRTTHLVCLKVRHGGLVCKGRVVHVPWRLK